MSIRIETILGCDGPCGEVYAAYAMRHLPAKEQRRHACVSDGWVTRRAKDYCKDCAEKLGIRRRASYSR